MLSYFASSRPLHSRSAHMTTELQAAILQNDRIDHFAALHTAPQGSSRLTDAKE